MGFWECNGISWVIRTQSAPRSRHITTPTPHHSIFTGRMVFLTPNQQCQSRPCSLQHNMTNSLGDLVKRLVLSAEAIKCRHYYKTAAFAVKNDIKHRPGVCRSMCKVCLSVLWTYTHSNSPGAAPMQHAGGHAVQGQHTCLSSVVCVRACLLVMSPTKTAVPIEMSSVVLTQVGPRTMH